MQQEVTRKSTGMNTIATTTALQAWLVANAGHKHAEPLFMASAQLGAHQCWGKRCRSCAVATALWKIAEHAGEEQAEARVRVLALLDAIAVAQPVLDVLVAAAGEVWADTAVRAARFSRGGPRTDPHALLLNGAMNVRNLASLLLADANAVDAGILRVFESTELRERPGKKPQRHLLIETCAQLRSAGFNLREIVALVDDGVGGTVAQAVHRLSERFRERERRLRAHRKRLRTARSRRDPQALSLRATDAARGASWFWRP